jgi:hypothetical protein
MSKGIKESKELIEALGKLVSAGKKVAEDGKVDLSDLKHVVDLAKEYDVIVEGFKGVKEIDDEIKDLDLVEAQELLVQIFSVLK